MTLHATDIDPDAIAEAVGGAWQVLGDALPQGWARTAGGVTAVLTGAPAAMLNLAVVTASTAPRDDVDAALDALAATGLPHALQARPAFADRAEAIAADRGMTRGEDGPQMAVRLPLRDRPAATAPLAIRRLAPDEGPLHDAVAGAAFGAPDALLGDLVPPAVLGHPDLRGYVGTLDGEPVATALTVAIGDTAGVFNVGVVPFHQGHGLGAAIMRHIMNDAYDNGAAVGWLQSSEAGLRLYERLGFAVLERWPSWTSTPV